MHLGARLIQLIAILAASLLTRMSTFLKHTHTWGRTRWEQHCQARWEQDPRTAKLRMELEESRDAAKEETRQWQCYVGAFKTQVAFKLQCILAPCVNDGRRMYSPLYTMQCGCTVDAGLHNCMERGGMLCRGVYVHKAHLFSTVLSSLRQMECWMSKHPTTETPPCKIVPAPARVVTLVDQGTDPMPPSGPDTLALQHIERLLEHCKDPISLEVLETPVILNCGHAIEAQSLATFQRTASSQECPVCRQTIRSQCRAFALQSTIAAIKGLLAAKSE
jgi:hypothetical protein